MLDWLCMNSHCPIAVGIVACLALALPSVACDTPVFQWALERWPADDYELVVFHSGPLDAAPARIAAQFGEDPKANVRLLTVDVASELDDSIRVLWHAQQNAALPHMVVGYPRHQSAFAEAWSGPFTEDNVKAALDSAARSKVAARILAGDAAVWVLLEFGEPAKDAAAAQMVQTHIERAPEALFETATRPAADSVQPSFSMVRVARDDPLERVFVQMLLRTEPDLASFDEPMVFPVYGRGRALYALVGAGITERNILEACHFVVAGCSCEIKAQNPGTDLLMSVDWETALAGAPMERVTPFPVQAPAAPDVPAQLFGGGPLVWSIAIGLVAALAFIAAATCVIARKKRSNVACD